MLMVNMMNNGHAKLAEWGFSHISMPKDAKILDVGCGGGANITVWLDKCSNGHVTGLDYSDVSVNKSVKVNSKAIQEKRCEVVQGNVADMPFKDNSFDCVSAFETIYFWPGLERCFKEVSRVLKPHAKFLVVVESDGTDRSGEKWAEKIEGMTVYKEEEIIRNLEKSGFEIAEVVHNEKNWMCIVADKKVELGRS